MTRLFIFVLWLLHWLPLPFLAVLGNGLGMLLYALGRERRRVTRTNLRLCFPDMGETEREKLVRAHFRAFGRSFLERGLAWWASGERLRRLIRLSGVEHLQALSGQPVILLVPHFVALDMAWIRLTLDFPMAGMYANQKNPVFNEALHKGRVRFNQPVAVSRQQGWRASMKAIKSGRPFFYLPDMDYGPKEALFVPFFGVPAATITGLSRFAAVTGARVLPCLVRALDGGAGYQVSILPPWPDYPSGDPEADTRRMNACIEEWVRDMPEQYYWVHKRFKTRPEGEKSFYDR
ncbi:MAG: lipid A biosynthesis acyltransferase [Rhodocyclaceae bacterium]|nr:lipid A biosynthesis acyltransferase [Rhodocyclaceae bacterium]